MADYIACGCPMAGHLPGCWLAEAEAIASEAADAAYTYDPPRHRTVAAIQALAEAGHLGEVPGDDDVLWGLLDHLTEVGLLGPVTEVIA